MAKPAFILRAHPIFTTTTARVHGGVRSAPPCTRAVIVVKFAGAHEINANFATMSAWLHAVARFSRKSQYQKRKHRSKHLPKQSYIGMANSIH